MRESEEESTEHPCELGWKVRWTRDLRLFFEELGVWPLVRKHF